MTTDEQMTLGAALQHYQKKVTPTKKSAAVEVYRVRRWLRHELSARALDGLKGADFRGYRDDRLEAGAAPGTVRKELVLISALYSVAVRDWGLETLVNPITKMRVPQDAPGRQGTAAAVDSVITP